MDWPAIGIQYLEIFDKLLEDASNSDDTGTIRLLVEKSNFGSVYWVFCILLGRKSRAIHLPDSTDRDLAKFDTDRS
jgi:hypothetical protein